MPSNNQNQPKGVTILLTIRLPLQRLHMGVWARVRSGARVPLACVRRKILCRSYFQPFFMGVRQCNPTAVLLYRSFLRSDQR